MRKRRDPEFSQQTFGIVFPEKRCRPDDAVLLSFETRLPVVRMKQKLWQQPLSGICHS